MRYIIPTINEQRVIYIYILIYIFVVCETIYYK